MTNAIAVQSGGRGLEGADKEDILLPRIVMMQKTSKWIEQYNLKPGDLVNTVTKKIVEDTTFIPVALSKYYDLLKQEGNRMIFEDRVFDKNSPKLVGRRQFPDKSNPQNELKANCNAVLAFISIIEGRPAVIKFVKTSYKAGKKLFNLAIASGGDLFSQKYKLIVSKDQNDYGTFYVLDVESVGPVTDEEHQAADRVYQAYAAKAQAVNGVPEVTETAEAESDTLPF